MSIQNKPKGFTLAELMIAVTILALLITFSTSVYINFFGSVRNVRAANLVYEEARFTMERIVKEIRNGTIDYEEYYNQRTHPPGSGINDQYGKNYCKYGQEFYDAGADEFMGTFDDVSLGKLKDNAISAIDGPIQENLYLININGDRRTYIKRFERESNGVTIGKVGLIKLAGQDFGIDHIGSQEAEGCLPDEGEGDYRIDTWLCDDGFTCGTEPVYGSEGCSGYADVISDNSFVDITPASLDIVDLKFIITPQDDPRKAYNEETVQIQPHVTIRLAARANSRLTNEFRMNRTPDIVLESTISARVYNEIITECNLQECTDEEPFNKRDCPRALGVCGPNDTGGSGEGDPAQQICNQGIFPGCGSETYQTYADALYGLDAIFPDGARTFYESGSEIASCDPDADGYSDCVQRRCSDDKDNDCNGVKDSEDPNCLMYLCNNGLEDAGLEDCVDVGGVCDFIRPLLEAENNDMLCSDGYDNDCGNGGADEFDLNCRQYLCNNGELDPPRIGSERVAEFAPIDYGRPNYVFGAEAADSALNEVCPDVGGLCADIHPHEESETSCYDDLDNDCQNGADELDSACKDIICRNGRLDCDLVNSDYEPVDILTGYNDALCNPLQMTDQDEQCVDVGGLLCGGFIAENDDAVCFDGKDNDCNNRADGTKVSVLAGTSDSNCCPNRDRDDNPNDIFSSMSDTCKPPFADELPPFGAIDCDDNDGDIYPGAIEICSDERYPEDYPLEELRNAPIDNNCSFANMRDADVPNALDRYDPTCCVDMDGDGYGISDAYIFYDNNITAADGTVLCGFSGTAHRAASPQELPDCMDTDPNINPGISETGALCNDDKDNDCDGLKDHIDSNPESFDPDCCEPGALEICDDGGSDENCSGENGFDDDYCVYASGRGFFDNFDSNDYQSGGTADWGDGQITMNDPEAGNQNAISALIPVDVITACTDIQSVTVTRVSIVPPGTNITYQISIDGGTTWCGNLNCSGDTMTEADIIGGANSIDFSGFGGAADNDLRWQAILYSNGVDTVPALNSLTLSFTCN